jgi:hypothetical protein
MEQKRSRELIKTQKEINGERYSIVYQLKLIRANFHLIAFITSNLIIK